MLSHTVKEILEVYISMSKDTVPKVVQKQIEVIYSTQVEDAQEVRHFFQHLKNACLEILKGVSLHFLPFLRFVLELKKEKAHLHFSIFLDPCY